MNKTDFLQTYPQNEEEALMREVLLLLSPEDVAQLDAILKNAQVRKLKKAATLQDLEQAMNTINEMQC